MADPPKVPQSLSSALGAADILASKIRAEQNRRGKAPSGEVQIALRKVQEARFWLRAAAGLTD